MPAICQDVTNIKKNKPVTFSGGANANCTFYDAAGMNSRRDPFCYTLSGNINMNVYGVLDLPFSFYYTKKNTTYNQPSFAHYGISPKYKFITLHAGYRSMQFSDYSLSGLTFLGGGIEVMPENSFIKGKAMYGRLVKAVPIGDTLSLKFSKPVYERWALGSMITLGKKANTVDLFMFKAWDKKSSLSDTNRLSINPHENLVLGINTSQKIAERFVLTGEYAISAYTWNTYMPVVKFETYTYANNFGSFFKPRYSTKFSNALDANLQYMADAFSLGATYTRIDPEYASMGSSYINNDIEEFQFSMSTSFFKKKLNVSGNFGKQHNNLAKQLQSKNIRTIGGINLSLSVKNVLNIALGYSNFNANTRPAQIIISDSINYVQVTENYNATLNYNWGKERFKHSVSLFQNLQTANTLDQQVEQVVKTGTRMSGSSVNYRVNYVPADIAVNVSYSINIYTIDSIKTNTYGPVITLMKPFLDKKATANLSFSTLRTKAKPNSDNNSIILHLNLSYRITTHHSVNFNNTLMFRNDHSNKETLTNNSKHSREIVAMLAYNFSF
jgi:hypothetical protein